MIRSFTLAIVISALIVGVPSAQTISSPQLILDNDFVRVSRAVPSTNGSLNFDEKNDMVLVRLSEGTASFVPKGSTLRNSEKGEAADLLVELKKHWDAEVRHPDRSVRLVSADAWWRGPAVSPNRNALPPHANRRSLDFARDDNSSRDDNSRRRTRL